MDAVSNIRAQRQALWRERDQKLLDRMRSELASLRRDAAMLETQMSELRTAWSAIHQRRATLKYRYNSLALSLGLQCLAPSLASDLPVDLLSRIFQFCVADARSDHSDCWDTAYFPQVPAYSSVTTSFIVATVSKHWRSVALATAPLWSFVVFSGTAGLGARSMDRFQLCLTRSGQVPLDSFVNGKGVEQSVYHGLLGLLYPCMRRWRCAYFDLPTTAPGSILLYFRGAAPQLERFAYAGLAAGLSWPRHLGDSLSASACLTHYYAINMSPRLSDVGSPCLKVFT